MADSGREGHTDKRACVRKLIGSDVELGNFIFGGDRTAEGSGHEASRAVLDEISGFPRRARSAPAVHAIWSQDWGRQYLAGNGGCVYIDLNHLEVCTPEVLGATDYLRAWGAMLEIARVAMDAANSRLENEQRIVLLANNSDGEGQSYGSHLSFLISRSGWDRLFHDCIYPSVFFLMAYQVSSIVFTGQGKVGAENGRPPVDYQISQRADFFDTLVGVQTTYRRPLVNSRDEPLCGPANASRAGNDPGALARLHVIFYDATLCQHATYLKVGVMQIILCMIEAGFCDPALMLRDPLRALQGWSHDPDLQVCAELMDGRRVSAVDLQFMFLEQARTFVEGGGCGHAVPEVGRILKLWEQTLTLLKNRDFDALAPRLDWVLKRRLIDQYCAGSAGRAVDTAERKYLDLVYSSLDPDEGLYRMMEKQGFVDRLVSVDSIRRRITEPPEDTRAWARAMLLRTPGADAVESMDWDRIRFTFASADTQNDLVLPLPDPLGFTRARCGHCFSAGGDLTRLVRSLGGTWQSAALPGGHPYAY